MPMDFKGFKKIHEDDHKAVMEHPKGHHITIAKSGLSHKLRKHLSALELHHPTSLQLADGGAVQQPQPDQNPISQGFTGATGIQGIKSSVKNLADGGEVADPSAPQLGADLAELGNTAPDEQPPVNPIGADNGLPEAQAPQQDPNAIPSPQQAFEQASNASNVQQQAATEQSQRDTGIKQQAVNDDKQALNDFSTISQKSSKEVSDMLADTKAGYIKPNHYMESLSTPQKISTAVGLVLGGMGGLGKSNIALDYLNQQIERDLQSQKSNQGTRLNLLSALQEKYKNDTAAANMFRVMRAAQISDQLGLSAQKAGTQQAQVANLAAQAAISDKYRPLKMQSDALEFASRSNASPESKIRAMQMAGAIPQQTAEQANKDLDVYSKTKAAHDAVDDIVPQIMKQEKVGNRVLNPIQSTTLINSLRSRLIPLMLESSPSKRLTRESIEAEIAPNLPGFFTGKSTAKQLTDNLHKTIDTLADKPTTLKGLGITPPTYSPTVTVVLPNGTRGSIPKANLRAAQAKGAKLVE